MGDFSNPMLQIDRAVPKNGWVFVFVNNESNAPVWFDDLGVGHSHGLLTEESHYYPHGGKIAAISTKAFGKLPNRYGYQGEYSEEDEETGWNEFVLRNYDPQVGRWTGADPYDEFASHPLSIVLRLLSQASKNYQRLAFLCNNCPPGFGLFPYAAVAAKPVTSSFRTHSTLPPCLMAVRANSIYSIQHHLRSIKTPSVRNAALTAPYMHNGVYKTLEEVVDFYDRGGAGRGFDLSNQTLPADRSGLNDAKKKRLVSFLHALTYTDGKASPKRRH